MTEVSWYPRWWNQLNNRFVLPSASFYPGFLIFYFKNSGSYGFGWLLRISHTTSFNSHSLSWLSTKSLWLVHRLQMDKMKNTEESVGIHDCEWREAKLTSSEQNCSVTALASWAQNSCLYPLYTLLHLALTPFLYCFLLWQQSYLEALP